MDEQISKGGAEWKTEQILSHLSKFVQFDVGFKFPKADFRLEETERWRERKHWMLLSMAISATNACSCFGHCLTAGHSRTPWMKSSRQQLLVPFSAPFLLTLGLAHNCRVLSQWALSSVRRNQLLPQMMETPLATCWRRSTPSWLTVICAWHLSETILFVSTQTEPWIYLRLLCFSKEMFRDNVFVGWYDMK